MHHTCVGVLASGASHMCGCAPGVHHLVYSIISYNLDDAINAWVVEIGLGLCHGLPIWMTPVWPPAGSHSWFTPSSSQDKAYTPLMSACLNSHYDVVKLLTDHRADYEAQSSVSVTTDHHGPVVCIVDLAGRVRGGEGEGSDR